MEKRERHFVLVHGSCHGAWNWYKVVTLLKSAGHKVTALDLAASGIHPTQAHELRSLSDYLEPLMEFMASLPAEERVILVGHSFGGSCISVAMEKFPEKISVAVYATALMPGPDLDFLALKEEISQRLDPLKDSQFTFDRGPNNAPTSLLLGYKSMATKLYQFSPPEEDFQRWMIENNPADEVKVITGSDHMVMFSKPKELCLCLQEIAEKYS
nr:polyneuridine-aldehyde esterase-like isoform X1 [Quercus suber]XP_023926576.1 polyneuridine-aldehyde esterase-like isoform X1 [Quercus suber]